MDVRRCLARFLVPGLPSLRRCAMLPASRSWRTDHVDHLACLPDRVHGRHNVRLRCIGERFDFDARRGGPLEIIAMLIALISGGLSMIGIAQGLRLLLLLVRSAPYC